MRVRSIKDAHTCVDQALMRISLCLRMPRTVSYGRGQELRLLLFGDSSGRISCSEVFANALLAADFHKECHALLRAHVASSLSLDLAQRSVAFFTHAHALAVAAEGQG